ncbi:MAG: sodium:solute symporter family protein [Planctomycetota bacterium]|jgi:SSS family solute:Na+ symporter
MQLFDTNFTTFDWAIVAGYLALSIVVGIWANRYVGNLSGYLVAGRTLRIRLALATMTGTEIGLVTVMYSAELGFVQQYASLYLAVYEFVILLAIGLTGFVVYRLRETGVLTIPEFYQQRYSRGVRVLGGAMMVLSGVLNMGLFLKAGSLFLVSITGLEGTVGLKLIMTTLLALVLFYTVLGGMISVVITDLIQFVVLGTAMVIVTYFVVADTGIDGFHSVVHHFKGYVDPTSSINPSNPVPEAGIGPLRMLSMAVILSVALMLWPAGASRTLAVKSADVAKKLYLWSAIPFLSRRTLPALWGIGAFAFFALHPVLHDEFVSREVSSLAAMPLYLAKILPPGLIGIVTAGMLAAFMSTHDSYLLCWSGVLTQDVVAPLMKRDLSEKERVLITRISIVVIGAMLLFWGLWYEVATDLWQYMGITGTVYLAGVFPVVIGGLYWKRSSSAGAYTALLSGLTAILALGPCVAWLNNTIRAVGLEFTVRSDHLIIASFLTSLVSFIVVSLLYPDDNATERPKSEVSEA